MSAPGNNHGDGAMTPEQMLMREWILRRIEAVQSILAPQYPQHQHQNAGIINSMAPTMPLMNPMVHHHHLYSNQHPLAIMMPNATAAIPNTSIPPPLQATFSYQQATGLDYNSLHAHPPASAQLPIDSPEDELTRKITQRIQEKLKRLNPNMSDLQLLTTPHQQTTFQLDAQAMGGCLPLMSLLVHQTRIITPQLISVIWGRNQNLL